MGTMYDTANLSPMRNLIAKLSHLSSYTRTKENAQDPRGSRAFFACVAY